MNVQVQLGDGKYVQTAGKGTIIVKTKSDNEKQISDVLYIPGLAHNLLSIGQLAHKGYLVTFHGNTCEILDQKSGLTMMTIEMTANKMFPVNFSCIDDYALMASSKTDSWLWHMRYGHLYVNGLKLLKQKNMVYGLPNIENIDHVCEGCIYGKQHRANFPIKKSWRAKAPLELVHADICGPRRTSSLSGCKYFLLFVDDFSRMNWVYFLKFKSEAFSKFLLFKKFVEKQSGYIIKI